MHYRPDIDGLRALAVLPVVLFHLGLPGFGGGYVGVDVFFVVSGFLITGILMGALRRGEFSLAQFYERRIRRLFPALFTVLAATSVAAAALLFPLDLRRYFESLVSALFFVSNVYFQGQSGYFDTRAHTRTLQHTWSLSVEEQFYLLFPVVLLWLFRSHRHRPERLTGALGVAFAVSFAASVWGSHHAAGATYYLAPTRAWELLAGGLLALHPGLVPTRRRVREALSALGVGLIAGSVVLYTEKTTFPGLGALPPVLGAVLLLATAPGTRVGRALSWRPAVYVGRISYPLYLWHWPLIVLTLYLGGGAVLEAGPALAVFAASLGLSALTDRFVEAPFRAGRVIARPHLFAGAALATGVLAAFATAGIGGGGWPTRFSEAVARVEAGAADASPFRDDCHTRGSRPLSPDEACVYGDAARPRFAFWGDSHAVELASVFGEHAGAHGFGVVHLSSSACPPSLRRDERRRATCDARNAAVLDFLVRHAEIDTVFLVGALAYRDLEAIAEGYTATVSALAAAGKSVVLVYPVPLPGFDVPHTLARHLLAGGLPAAVNVPRAEYTERARPVVEVFDRLLSQGLAAGIKPGDRLCDAERCRVEAGGDALYFDDNHLSIAGARRLGPLFDRYLERPM